MYVQNTIIEYFPCIFNANTFLTFPCKHSIILSCILKVKHGIKHWLVYIKHRLMSTVRQEMAGFYRSAFLEHWLALQRVSTLLWDLIALLQRVSVLPVYLHVKLLKILGYFRNIFFPLFPNFLSYFSVFSRRGSAQSTKGNPHQHHGVLVHLFCRVLRHFRNPHTHDSVLRLRSKCTSAWSIRWCGLGLREIHHCCRRNLWPLIKVKQACTQTFSWEGPRFAL